MNNAVKTALLLIALGVVIAIAPPNDTSPRTPDVQQTASTVDMLPFGKHL